MKLLLPLLILPVVLLVSAWAISQDGENEPVLIAVLEEGNFDSLVPEGKEVDAIYGDIVLRNKHLVAVIAQPLPTRNANMTVRDVGGALIDLTARSSQSDQLSCLYPGRVNPGYRHWTISTRETRGMNVAAGTTVRSGVGMVTVNVEGDERRAAVETEYKLTTDARVLTVTTTWKNNAAAPVSVNVGDLMRADGGKEDMVKSPNGVDGMYYFEDRFWGQAYGVRSADHRILGNSDARRCDLSYINSEEKDKVTLPPGGTVSVVREIASGASRLDVAAAFGRTDGEHFVPVSLAVWNVRRMPIAGARLEVSREGELLGVALADERGNVSLPLVPGKYSVKILANGMAIAEGYELLVSDAVHQEESIIVESYNPGTLRVFVVDAAADREGLPCKVEISSKEAGRTPNFGPETAEYGVRNLRYTANGRIRQELLPGKYDLIVSRGPEYSAIMAEVVIEAGGETDFNVALKRLVDSSGWVSSDFHSHSTPSGDNTSSQLGRVLNLVCEHVEFAPCTEHNRITTYDPHIAALGIAAHMATTTGMELTGSPLPLNHQNVFPLHHHPHRQDGGGPVTDPNPDVQVERIAKWDDGSEKLIQQNHPDLGWLVYDRNGDGTSDEGHAGVMSLIDVIEIHPIERVLDLVGPDGVSEGNVGGNVIFRWLQLLNQGYRSPGVVNTDAHYNFHGSGSLRNWIQSTTDDPAKIDTHEMMHAAEEGRLVMSNGPFLEVWATADDKEATVGQELAAPGKNVGLHVTVQCPDWFDIDTVFVLVNGKLHPEHVYRRSTHADKFGNESVKFDQQLAIELDQDAHIVVCCGGAESVLGPVMGPDNAKLHPAALGNPIYVDVDGNGFTPNKDTLGLPLPVKGK